MEIEKNLLKNIFPQKYSLFSVLFKYNQIFKQAKRERERERQGVLKTVKFKIQKNRLFINYNLDLKVGVVHEMRNHLKVSLCTHKINHIKFS